jgi:hypothetical protein
MKLLNDLKAIDDHHYWLYITLAELRITFFLIIFFLLQNIETFRLEFFVILSRLLLPYGSGKPLLRTPIDEN